MMNNSKIINDIFIRESNNIEKDDAFLQHGAMGNVIFWLWYARKTGEKKFKNIAFNELNYIYESVNRKSRLGIDDGLTGISLGICYLIHKEYLKGNLDYLLKDIDDNIYKIIMIGLSNNYADITSYEDTLLDVMLYLSFRLKEHFHRYSDKLIIQHLLIYILDRLYQNHSLYFYEEPLPGSIYYKIPRFLLILSEIHKLNIYNKRIEYILKEMEINVFSRIPICHSNRLYLFCALNELINEINLGSSWNNYLEFIKKNISLQIILKDEIKSNNVSFTKGLSWVYLMLRFCNRKQSFIDYSLYDFYIRFLKSDIYCSFKNSEWNNNRILGIDSILGIIMVIDDIENNLITYEKK